MKTYALLLALVAGVIGCGGGSPLQNPVISITKPTDGSKYPLIGTPPPTSVDIEVTFTVSNFTLKPPAETMGMNQPAQGHMHLYLDDSTNYTDAGVSPLTAKAVPQGMHKLTLILRNNDHSPVDGVTPKSVLVEVVP
jgi:hypothetical protein